MSRLYGRNPCDWTLHVDRDMIDVTNLGVSMHFPGHMICELELRVHDPNLAQRIFDEALRDNYERGCPSVQWTSYGAYRISGIQVTEAEANDIAHGKSPIDVLLPPPEGICVIAVAIDLGQLIRELELDALHGRTVLP